MSRVAAVRKKQYLCTHESDKEHIDIAHCALCIMHCFLRIVYYTLHR